MKFKVGGRVVLIKNKRYAAEIGATSVVTSEFDGEYFSVKWDNNKKTKGQMDGFYNPNDFELEAFYTSPLFQALK